MSSGSDVVDHYKRKFYQRFIDPDLTVESISLRSSQTSRPSTSATTSSTTQQDLQEEHLLKPIAMLVLYFGISKQFSFLSMLGLQRNMTQTIMYWQLLKLMYFAPVMAGYHQSISRSVTPALHHHAPFLNTPIAAVQRWWFR